MIVSGRAADVRTIAIPKFWELYQHQPAWEFARFLALCDKGKPIARPPGRSGGHAGRARNVADVEASIKWTQAFLAKL